MTAVSIRFVKLNIGFALVVTAFSCSSEDEGFDYSQTYMGSGELLLTEYRENDNPFYAFTYTPDSRLNSITFFATKEITYSMTYNDSTGKPIYMSAVFGRNQLKMELTYQEDLLEKYRFTVNDQEAFRVKLFYDSLARVLKTVYESDHELGSVVREFSWEGNNVSKVQIYSADNPAVFPYRYEYEYDGRVNPFLSVYKSIGYNLAENFPLCESNWTQLKVYEPGAKFPSFEVTNRFTYWGLSYPYDRLTEGRSSKDGREDPVYSVFIYK